MTMPRMKVATTALARKSPLGSGGRLSLTKSCFIASTNTTPLSRYSPMFKTIPAIKPPSRTRPTLICFIFASLRLEVLLVRACELSELFGQRRLNSEQPLIDGKLAAVIHLMRQCELKHSPFRDLLTIKSGQKLIEFLIAEPSDFFTARSQRGTQQRDDSVLRCHDSDFGIRRLRKKSSQVGIVAADFADQHALRFDHVIKQFEHAARLSRGAEIEFVFGNALGLFDQAFARVFPLRQELFDLCHELTSGFKPCSSLRAVSTKNVSQAPSRDVLTPGGKN